MFAEYHYTKQIKTTEKVMTSCFSAEIRGGVITAVIPPITKANILIV